MDNKKNLLLAVVFSIAVLFGLTFFGPKRQFNKKMLLITQIFKNDKSNSIDTEAPSIKVSFVIS